MEFKRLNNMTGQDPVLNKRIIFIFINELESLRQHIGNLKNENLSDLELAIRKIKPSLLIFEMDNLVKDYEVLMNLLKNENDQLELDSKKILIITNIDKTLGILKESLNPIN